MTFKLVEKMQDDESEFDDDVFKGLGGLRAPGREGPRQQRVGGPREGADASLTR